MGFVSQFELNNRRKSGELIMVQSFRFKVAQLELPNKKFAKHGTHDRATAAAIFTVA